MNFCARSSVSRGVLKPVACAALAVTLLSQPASAVTVRFGAFDYDIQFYGLGTSFDDVESTGVPPIKDAPWWNDSTLAGGLAEAYRVQVGVDGSPFTDDSSPLTEIRFAFDEDVDANSETVFYAFLNEIAIDGQDPLVSDTNTDSDTSDADATYAYAASVSPVPLPPAGLALGAALLGLLGLRRWKAAAASRTA